MDKEILFESLTRYNYFPNQKSDGGEMPPIFSSRQFTPAAATGLAEDSLRTGGYDKVDYFATRYNNVPRLLSIPHPMAYAHLVGCITNCWDEISYICENENSIVKPELHPDGRIIIMDYEESTDQTMRAIDVAFGKKFRVRTDIAGCFPSIYSHAIPWAAVGIDFAKKHKHPKYQDLWFNKLDFHQRMVTRNETQGVPIGPATSNIMCELILSRIDGFLKSKYSFYRYIDDYTCYCGTFEEGQEFLRELGGELRKYKLNLNLNKTEIVKLPAPIDPDWILELGTRMPVGMKEELPTDLPRYSAKDVIRYLDYAVHLSKQSPDGSVLKFAVKSVVYRLQEHAVRPVLEYLLHLVQFYPILLPTIESLLTDDSINAEEYAEQLNLIACENAINCRSDGMCWSLYFLEILDLGVSAQTAKTVIESQDALAITLIDKNEDHEPSVVQFVSNLAGAENFELDQYWILLYQRFLKQKTDCPYENENCFNYLREMSVNFIPDKDQYSPSELEIMTAGFDVVPDGDGTITENGVIPNKKTIEE